MSFSPELHLALQHHARRHPEMARTAARFQALLKRGPGVFERDHPHGHFTGSAWLVSADAQRVLLTHHRKLGRWLQLGGHADGEFDLAQVALREANEESGLADLSVLAEIFDLDCHWIPARGAEPGHWHYDVRYIVRAGADEAFRVSAESLALAWRPIALLAADPGTAPSLRRMARRWLEYCGNGDGAAAGSAAHMGGA